jgi:molybdenum cofactor cytidylyltransferase
MPTPPLQPNPNQQIGAIVLAAGQSRRMGQPKMSLPWGNTTVIAQVVEVLLTARLTKIYVITGSRREQVEKALESLPAQTLFNPQFAGNDMVHSLQIGLSALKSDFTAALVVLGDQPQIELDTVQQLIIAYQATSLPLIVPSYQHRRGHPWLVGSSFWPEILAIRSPATLRDFLNAHAEQIHYLNVNSPSILRDLDTPADYARERPGPHDKHE